MRARVVWAGLALLAVGAAPALGQDEVVGVLRGSVLLPDAPVDSGWVVLHRFGTEEPAAVDSLRLGPGGEFSFTLPTLPREGGDLYLTSIRWDGVVYFGPPVENPIDLDSAQVVRVYPTRRVEEEGTPARTGHRTVVLDRTPPGWRVTELHVVLNELPETLITGPEGAPTYRYPLPTGAAGFQVGESDLSPEGSALVEGGLWVSDVMPPGEHVYVFQYAMADSTFEIPVPAPLDSLELFIAEPSPDLTGAGLVDGGGIMDSGRAFRLWTATGEVAAVPIAPGPAEDAGGLPVRGLFALLALALTAAGVWAVSKRPERDPAG